MTRKTAIELLTKAATIESIVGITAKRALAENGIDTTGRRGQWEGALLQDIGLKYGKRYGVVAIAQRLQRGGFLA